MWFIMYLYLQNIAMVNFNPWFVVKHFDPKFQIFASQYMLWLESVNGVTWIIQLTCQGFQTLKTTAIVKTLNILYFLTPYDWGHKKSNWLAIVSSNHLNFHQPLVYTTIPFLSMNFKFMELKTMNDSSLWLHNVKGHSEVTWTIWILDTLKRQIMGMTLPAATLIKYYFQRCRNYHKLFFLKNKSLWMKLPWEYSELLYISTWNLQNKTTIRHCCIELAMVIQQSG